MNRTWFTPGTLQIKATSLHLVNDPSGTLTIPNVVGNTPASPQMLTVGPSGIMGSQAIPASGALSFAAVGNTPNANGGVIAGTVLTLEPAGIGFPGVLTAGAQNIDGPKTFNDSLIVSNSIGIPPGTTNYIAIGEATITDYDITGQHSNIIIGPFAGNFTGNYSLCTLVGAFAGNLLGSTSRNTFIGYNAGADVTTGGNDICIGQNAGSQYTSSETNCICIGSQGVNGESNQIRIGTHGSQTACAIQGIFGNSPSSAQAVTIDTNGNMGSQAIPAAVSFTSAGSTPNSAGGSVSGNAITLQPASITSPGIVSLGAQTFNGPKTGNFQLAGGITGFTHPDGSNLIFDGGFSDSSSVYIGASAGGSMTTGTNNNNAVGRLALNKANTAIGNNSAFGDSALKTLTTGTFCVGLGANSGSNYAGAESNNICLDAPGTALESGVINIGRSGTHTVCKIRGISGVTPGGTPQMVTVGTGDQLGSTAIPAAVSFAAVGSTPSANGATVASNVVTLQAASNTSPGVITTTSQTMTGGKTWSSTAAFVNGLTLSASAKIMQSTGTTLLWAGNNNDTSCVFAGNASGAAATQTTGTGNNVGVGQSTLALMTQGVRNVALGTGALGSVTGASGVGNNTCVGFNTGSAYTANEQSNICIGSGVVGVAGESNVTRIGGISGATSAAGVAVVINASGQLGTVVSSKKYKKDIMDIDYNPIMEFDCVQYKELNNKTDEIHFGFIAEQVLPILPQAIVFEKLKDKDGNLTYDSIGNLVFSTTDPETIQYHKLWPLLQDYVKKMDNRLKRLEREFEETRERPTKKAKLG